jgi:G6PDH family F420-dependent oxidoreductase
MELGYALSSEEHAPDALVRQARMAEEAGFSFALISDHYHPWIDRQGQSGFVWSIVGGIAQVTERLRLGTGVTCPLIRIHPAIIAQAAATAALLMPDRFFLGVGTGENLNEHILGDHWPPADVRRDMLCEAVEIMRLLWQGGRQSYAGRHYTLENARVYSLPEAPPPVYVAASGDESAALAGKIGDGLISTAPEPALIDAFEAGGGQGKPRYGQVTVCWARDEASAKRTALEVWPTAGLKGALITELALPAHFEAAAELVTEDMIAQSIVCGPDRQKHLDKIREFVDAGYDHIYIHQVGPNQEGFFEFYAEQVLPHMHQAQAIKV